MEAGWAWTACPLAALAALLLALRRLRRSSSSPSESPPSAPAPSPAPPLLQVHVVESAPRVQHASPASTPPVSPPPGAMIRPRLSVEPPTSAPAPAVPAAPAAPAAPATDCIPKLPLPEQWLVHKKPFEYSTAIPRPLAQIEVEVEASSRETRAKKFSATRSPSLEKDDKSPFLGSAKSDKSDVFGFEPDLVKRIANEPCSAMEEGESSGNLRRYRSVCTRLNVCSAGGPQQEAPRVVECGSAKEKSSSSKFDFSPKLLADSISSPKYFTPPENISPVFFPDPSPKSVYYDTVRSPKFFPDTPRCEPEMPQSPRAFGDFQNRNNGVFVVTEKPSSPRILAVRSPKIHSRNKENYFTFDHSSVKEESGTSRLSPRPRRYGGRNSLEKERTTPPMDRELRKYRRHNSCDTNFKNIEINISKLDYDQNANEQEPVAEINRDVVDCCAKISSIDIKCKIDSPSERPHEHLSPSPIKSAQVRRQRLKSISLDSDNAKIIEQNLGLPIAKQLKDSMDETYQNLDVSSSCHSMERSESFVKSIVKEKPAFEFNLEQKESIDMEEPKSPDIVQKKGLRQSCDTQSFLDMPRFSPKEFEITVTSEEGDTTAAETHIKKKGSKNLRNLTIDLTKRDSDLEKELLEFEKLYEEKKVKTPTLKVKATSLDSSETVNLSLPQKKSLEVPQNSVSVPNTPKRQIKRILTQKKVHDQFSGGKIGYNSLQYSAEQRKLLLKGQDSGIYLRENHASLMLYQPSTSRMSSRAMGSFDENITDFTENTPEISISKVDGRYDTGQTLGSNLLNYKPNLSVSSTNLKTLPEGVPSDDFEPSAEDDKFVKKLHRRNSNQSLMFSDGKFSTHSLQGSNCSLNSGASSHNLASVRTSVSNFSLNTDNRARKLSLERRDSNASMAVSDHLNPSARAPSLSNTGEHHPVRNCLLQRRGSNNSLSLNLQCSNNNLTRHSSNTSLNKEAKVGAKKGLLERRSSNTSLTLNINNSNPQLSVNRALSISNYNLNGSSCNLSRYNSNQSIDNPAAETRKGILERRSSNTSLTLNIPQEPRDIEIDEALLETKLPSKQRKSLSTENLLPKSYKNRLRSVCTEGKGLGFGSHDNLWSNSFSECVQNLTYVCGDQENEMIYAFGRQIDDSAEERGVSESGFVRNITTKPLSPQSTSEEFRQYLANMHHLQTASSVLSRRRLRDLHEVFQNGYSKVKCHASNQGQHCCSGRVKDSTDVSVGNPQMEIPEVNSQPCSEYQKTLLRNLHQEFWDMPTNFQEKPMVSGSHTKNRYKSILPNEHSRFILKSESGAGSDGYINANFIKGHEYTKNSYIATQGPLPNTMYDFWLMIHQISASENASSTQRRRIHKIVMLTNFVENNRQKCERYFPLELNEEVSIENPESAQPGDRKPNCFVVKNSGLIKKCGYTIRKLDIQYKNYDVCDKVIPSDNFSDDSDNIRSDSDVTTIYHYWFHNWADHKCPKDVNALLNLSLDILKDVEYDFSERLEEVDLEGMCKCGESPKTDSKFVFPPLEGSDSLCEAKSCSSELTGVSDVTSAKDVANVPGSSVVVHCSAGIGRTGCLLAALAGIEQLTAEHKVDVLGIVCTLRLGRGGMVQNSEQYELVHKVLCLYEQACMPASPAL